MRRMPSAAAGKKGQKLLLAAGNKRNPGYIMVEQQSQIVQTATQGNLEDRKLHVEFIDLAKEISRQNIGSANCLLLAASDSMHEEREELKDRCVQQQNIEEMYKARDMLDQKTRLSRISSISSTHSPPQKIKHSPSETRQRTQIHQGCGREVPYQDLGKL